MAGMSKGRFYWGVTLYLCHHSSQVTSVQAYPCAQPNLLGNTTGIPCGQTDGTPPLTDDENQQEYFINTPYIFVVLCALVLLPFLILLKVWWVRKMQSVQYRRSQVVTRQEEPEICVIDPAVFAPPPSYEECMTLPPPYDYLPAYKDLKFDTSDKPNVPSEEPGTSAGSSLPQ